ncbi:DUF5074 domain-containing protein [Arachidicoccus ginsenosidimutans]|uniref:DUF5074 domain-containing protein n=1 Tax=Arachidicoccus sp. BS20 TaxID=1850526 RepID=UPI0012E8C5FA|nr:DUF5074 domain-containing protein [Arachidicoccus sp. BS20]
MKHTKHLCTLALGATLLIVGCSKNDSPSTPDKTYKSLNDGLYVLNEGSGHNNTYITYYDSITKDTTTDIYSNVNSTQLGNFGNDELIYGNKLYVVINGSNYVSVMDKRTAKLLAQINAADGDSWQPRNLATYNGEILVSAWDGTVSVIDTSSLTITNTIKAGTNLETMTVVGNTLYVASSGGATYPQLDSTVSIVDLNTMKETKRLKVGINPQKVVADFKGNVYVLVWGYSDYSNPSNPKVIAPSKIYKIDATTQTVTDSSSVITTADKMAIYNDVLYLDGSGNQPVFTLNTNNLHDNFVNFITDGTTLMYPYGINVDESNGNVYVTDAKDGQSPGEVYCFDKTGKMTFTFWANIFPDKVVFLR